MNEQPHTHCVICGEAKGEGIQIMEAFICEACEAEIVGTDAQDERYPFFIHQLRHIWIQKNA